MTDTSPNSTYRVREYLTEKEVERLVEAAKKRGPEWSRGCRSYSSSVQTWTKGQRTLFSSLDAD
jgi:hypothetical protein